MSEERRIILWRRAIFQFRRFRDREGAFYKAGLRNFVIEQNIVGLTDSRPDIICWRTGDGGHGDDMPLILELTLDDSSSKLEQIERYRSLTPGQLAPVGVSASISPEVVLGTLTGYRPDEEVCILTFSDELSCSGTEYVKDERTRKALEESEGMDLVHIPEIHFTIVPESKPKELRRGIGGRLLSRFAPNAESFTAEDVAMDCLDFIAPHIAMKSREMLIKSVGKQLDILATRYLKDYLTVGNGMYVLTEKGRKVHTSPQSREKVSRIVSAWMNETTIDEYLSDFDESAGDEPR